jgi:hypothetical protein
MPELFELPPSALAAANLRASLKVRGHAAQPGTGPEGETCGTCNAEIGAWCRWAPARSLHRCRADMAEALGFVTVDEMPLMEKADAGVPQLRRARGRSAVSKAVQAGIDLP